MGLNLFDCIYNGIPLTYWEISHININPIFSAGMTTTSITVKGYVSKTVFNNDNNNYINIKTYNLTEDEFNKYFSLEAVCKAAKQGLSIYHLAYQYLIDNDKTFNNATISDDDCDKCTQCPIKDKCSKFNKDTTQE